jgi:simple sugar transport system permease protein
MGGAVESLGVIGRYQPGFNVGLGFDGITIALLAKTNPLGCIPAALLIGAMQAGANTMQFDAGVQAQIIDIIQGLILFFVSADMIVRKILGAQAVDEDKVQLSSGWGS